MERCIVACDVLVYCVVLSCVFLMCFFLSSSVTNVLILFYSKRVIVAGPGLYLLHREKVLNALNKLPASVVDFRTLSP